MSANRERLPGMIKVDTHTNYQSILCNEALPQASFEDFLMKNVILFGSIIDWNDEVS